MTFSQYITGKAIQTGSDWELTLRFASEAGSALFPVDASFLAHMVDKATGEVAAGLSSVNGLIERIDGQTLKLTLSADQTKDWKDRIVAFDIIRVDTAEPVHLGFDVEIPVKRSVTRPE
jgi:hypothetical protein